MNNVTLSTKYTELRLMGYTALVAFNQAKRYLEYMEERRKTLAKWDELETQGKVRLKIEPDYDADLDDLLGDSYDPTVNPDIPAKRLAQEREWEIDRINREGVWGIVGQYKCKCCGSWTTADSVWGVVGDDWKESGYDLEIMQNTMDQLE